MASAISDSFMHLEGRNTPSPRKILETTNGMTMKVLPDFGIYQKTNDDKEIWKNLSGL